MRARGFPPVAAPAARIMILGSLPGRRSIAAGQYYAHPRNAFWRIVEDLFGIPRTEPYARRAAALTSHNIALWDVLESSERRGSLDAAIETESAVVNDLRGFLGSQPEVRLVAFNGRKAAALYRKLVLPELADGGPETAVLPSTSPAHASMPYAEKLGRWSEALCGPQPARGKRLDELD